MQNMNEHLSPQQVGQIMQEFSKESSKMDMSEEMSESFLGDSVDIVKLTMLVYSQ